MKKHPSKAPLPKQRITWGFDPSSRVKESKKVYSRKLKLKLEDF